MSGGKERRGGRTFALGLLLGIGLDTAIKGAFGTLDLSWQPGSATYVIVILLLGCHWLLLKGVVRDGLAELSGGGGFLRMAPLVSLGSILFLELLLFQNIGQQTALIGWDQPLIFIWVAIANLVGLVVAMGVMTRPSYGGRVSALALGGLLALVALGERSGLGAALVALYGQVAISAAMGVVGVAIVSGKRRPGIGALNLAGGLGMLLLLVLTPNPPKDGLGDSP